MSTKPTYLFGVGATKAGTTWMHRYLAKHPECHLRAIKELHYFDSVEQGSFARQVKVQQDRAEKLASQLQSAPEGRAARLERSLMDVIDWISVLTAKVGGQGDHARYAAYLEAGTTAGTKLVADITPSYSELGPETLRGMEKLAPETRFVYVLREPVSRLWSHVRMVASRSSAADQAAEANRIFDRVIAGEPSQISRRSDYAGTLNRLQSALSPNRLLVLFQEQLHSAPGVARLCEFLGISVRPAPLDTRVHEGAAYPMTAGQEARARAFLSSQYDFVAQRFADMPASWRAPLDGVTA